MATSSRSVGWSDEAGGSGDDVVGSLGAEPGGTVRSGGDTSGRAVALGVDAGPEHRHRLGDAAGPAQRLLDDRHLGAALGVEVEVHPAATAAAGEPRGARRRDPIGAGLDDVDDVGPGPVTLLVDDLGDHGLAR